MLSKLSKEIGLGDDFKKHCIRLICLHAMHRSSWRNEFKIIKATKGEGDDVDFHRSSIIMVMAGFSFFIVTRLNFHERKDYIMDTLLAS